jgi:hypothetical protein
MLFCSTACVHETMQRTIQDANSLVPICMMVEKMYKSAPFPHDLQSLARTFIPQTKETKKIKSSGQSTCVLPSSLSLRSSQLLRRLPLPNWSAATTSLARPRVPAQVQQSVCWNVVERASSTARTGGSCFGIVEPELSVLNRRPADCSAARQVDNASMLVLWSMG